MSLRDALSALFGDGRFTTCEFMDSANTEVLADAVLALLRGGPWFDEAVERAALELAEDLNHNSEVTDGTRELARLVLRAALGEDTQ